jgi:hypothetical protein
MNWCVFWYEFHMKDLELLYNSTDYCLTTNYCLVVLIIMYTLIIIKKPAGS